MDIEQLPPKSPNFLLIVGLFAGAILVIFVLALIFLRVDSGHLAFRNHTAHPTSWLETPAVPFAPAAPVNV
jgi:hypothetical protein